MTDVFRTCTSRRLQTQVFVCALMRSASRKR